MGTRGTHGVRIGGVDKLTYNQFDTYPEGLGTTVLEELRAILEGPGKDWLRARAETLRLVPQDGEPTAEEAAAYAGLADVRVSTGKDWYSTLRELQGTFRLTLEVGLMTDGAGFIADSLFCEWGYIVNLDDELLEVYRGFQTEPHTKGRYALPAATRPQADHPGARPYYPCALIAAFPFDGLPDADAFVAAIRKAEEPDEDTTEAAAASAA